MAQANLDLASVRASAMRVAEILLKKGSKAEAIEVLTVWASASNDPDGHKLLAEALRHGADNPLAKAAFAKMEGLATDQSLLDAARAKWTSDALARIESEAKKPVSGGWQAEVGYNNNVKYKDQVFHIQTEDSGVKRPHIITHLFADGGRILKSYKRSYAELIGTPNLSDQVRAWMKGQHKEMYIALREGRFDGIIEGRESGGMEVFEGQPNPEVRRKAQASLTNEARASSPSVTSEVKPLPSDVIVPTGVPKVSPSQQALSIPKVAPPQQAAKPQVSPKARLHVIRALGDGPILHELRSESSTIGRDGDVTVVGDKFVSPKHATLTFRSNKLEIEDAGSANGTFLRIRSPVEITFGDVFIAGDQLLRIEANPPPNDGPDASPTYFYSSPKWPTTFRIVQLWEGGITGLTVVARTNAVQIGRRDSELSFPQDFWLNDAHCLIEDQGGFFMLTDLGSRGGTFVKVKAATRLTTGDEILVGRTRLRVEMLVKASAGSSAEIPAVR